MAREGVKERMSGFSNDFVVCSCGCIIKLEELMDSWEGGEEESIAVEVRFSNADPDMDIDVDRLRCSAFGDSKSTVVVGSCDFADDKRTLRS